jgi:hypothetical protein
MLLIEFIHKEAIKCFKRKLDSGSRVDEVIKDR